MDASTIPRQTTTDVDGNQIGQGDLVECVDAEDTCGVLEHGRRYQIAGVHSDRTCISYIHPTGFIRTCWAARFRKLAPTPLDKREDA